MGTALRVDVFTIFPEMVRDFAAQSLLGKACQAGSLDIRAHDLRDGAHDVHRTVDDAPYGGGAGMVLKPEPVATVVEAADPPRPLFYLGPGGRRLDQAFAVELATGGGFSLLCGRYEGLDQRVIDHVCDGVLSIGDYVLAGGEVASMVVLEAVGRLVPGVMGNDRSASEESFGDARLEYPQYTRPATFRGHAVPDVLTSGDHGRVARWRLAQAALHTAVVRPDLFSRRPITDAEAAALAEFGLTARFDHALTADPGDRHGGAHRA